MFGKRKYLQPASAIICSIILIVVGLVSYINAETKNRENDEFIANADIVQAYITNTYTHVGSNRGSQNDDIYVKYDYKGISYKKVYVGFVPIRYNYKVGDLITVYVDPNNPQNARIPQNNSTILGIIIISVGVLLVVVSSFKYIKQKNQPVTYNPRPRSRY
ncbi:MAG: DUF3592 domain-containing protein [Acutalibacteraceae bacterium]